MGLNCVDFFNLFLSVYALVKVMGSSERQRGRGGGRESGRGGERETSIALSRNKCSNT